MTSRNGSNGTHERKPAAARPYFLLDCQWWLITTAGMSANQRAGFIQLCVVGWQSEPPATIPDDDDEQAAIAGFSVDEWKRIRRPVLAQTTKSSHRGRLTITKLHEQFAMMCAQHDDNVRKGRAGAAKRWQR